MRYCELIITGILALICLLACSEQNRERESTLLNTAHLDHLYEEVQVAGQDIGFIHIYAEHPDYHLVGDPNEGMACVDDAARAAIFYLNYANKYEDKETLRKAERLLKFYQEIFKKSVI